MNNPTPYNEIEEITRLQTVLSFNILDTPYEQDFDGLVQLASLICDCPIAIISMIDDTRQWYKAKVGIDRLEVPKEETFCQHTILQDDLLIISDAQLDERVKENPNVKGNNGIRFYAGLPLKAKNGYNIGTVCVVDSKPKTLSAEQKKALRLLTDQAMMLLEARKNNKELSAELENILDQKVKKTRQQLLEKKIQFNLLLKAIRKSNGVVEFSPEGYFKSANQKFLNIVGYSKDEILDHHQSILLDEEQKKTNQAFWQSLREGKYKTGRLKRIHKNGTEIWLQASYNPIPNLDNVVTRVIKISQDITKEIKAEEALLKAKELAEKLNIQKDYFIANVSHEIRTPIHAILGFTELILEQENDNLKKSYLQSVKTAGDNLLYIINDILDLSKIEAGIFQIEKEGFNLKEVIINVFSILHLKGHQKKILFQYEIAPDVPLELLGDKNRLTQILINLLGNAIKFTSEGRVHLFVSLTENEGEKAELQFVVEDTGIGISEEKSKIIFERFAQAEEETSRKFGGTGLGLNISKQLIEKQGGSINVKSKPGKGSTFTFSIKYEINSIPTQKLEFLEQNSAKFEVDVRILLCEDNELNQKLIKAILIEKGYSVDLAENGDKAIDLYHRNNYDLILMDIQMPSKDGYQTTKIIRAQEKKFIPIIALTANFMLIEREKCITAGMNDYLSKPFTKDELLKKIEANLPSENNNISSEGKKKIISLEILDELSGGNQEFQKELIEVFKEQGVQGMMDLREALEKDNFEVIKKVAHKLKSSFGIIGANLEFLEALENIDLENPDVPVIIKNLEALKEQLNSILFTLEKMNMLNLT